MKVIIDSQQLGQNGGDVKVELQNIIDNRNDDHVVCLRDISFYVGYYNISQALHNTAFEYSNGSKTYTIHLTEGLYNLQKYFDKIKTLMYNQGDKGSYIHCDYQPFDGRIQISVTPPYTFSILQHQTKLLGFDNPVIITNDAISDKPINFVPCRMLYIHLKQLKNHSICFNGITSDVLAKAPVTINEFGTLIHHVFDSPHKMELINTTINSLELSITDENNKIIDFHGMPIFYTLEISKK